MPTRSLVFPRAWIWKEVVRNLRLQTRWTLESNCRENAAELRRIRSSDIPLYQCFGERRFQEAKEERHQYTSMAAPKTLSCFSRWSSPSISSVSMEPSWSESCKAPGQLDKVEIITQLLLAEMQANEERQGNLLQKYETMFTLSCFLKHLVRLVEHLSFGCTVLWSSTGILLNDKARDWSKIAIGLLECCRTPRVLQISPATAINDPDFWKCTAIRTLKFFEIIAKFEDVCVVHVDE